MKLPIGIQTFEKIRSDEYIYIDKTKEAYELIKNYQYAFLSRPRRFGKSLFLDTLKNIFEGKKELFKGLYIYDKWNWEEKYPVIKISWDGRNRSIKDLISNTKRFIKDNQERLEVECQIPLDDINCFYELIVKTYKKYKKRVVILIDEYDKPILDVIEDINQAKEHREYIKGLYSIIKGSDEYIRFAFLTGVSKFSKASVFSGLNMLVDISLDKEFGNVCGYTHEDVKEKFKEYLDGIDLKKVKQWYNGYYFLKDRLYNPFDILLFLRNGLFRNYWFESGTPTFLLKLIKENHYFLPKLSNLVVGEEIISSFDIENINLEVILYQAGYLTIDKIMINEDDEIEYLLKLPNKEVKISLNRYIIDFLFKGEATIVKSIRKALKEADLNEFRNILSSIFSSIPYNNLTYIKNYEGFYASVVYVYLQALGIEIIGEDVTNKGRIDLTCFIDDKIYIIEFKVDKEDNPLKQIKERKYYEKYQKYQDKSIYLVGINFDSKNKNINNFKWEKLFG